mgnify:CR=1 FL=1
MNCFELEKLTKTSVNCTGKYQILKNNALAFTNYSQNLLFTAKTAEFYKFNEENNDSQTQKQTSENALSKTVKQEK